MPEINLTYVSDVARRQLASGEAATWLATVGIEEEEANNWSIALVEQTLSEIQTEVEDTTTALAETLQQVALLGLLTGIALNKSDEPEDEINVEIDPETIEQIGLSIIRTGSLAIRLTPADSDASSEE